MSRAGWKELERDGPLALVEYRWWTLEEIQASKDIFVPRGLPNLLSPILTGELPARPVEVGL